MKQSPHARKPLLALRCFALFLAAIVVFGTHDGEAADVGPLYLGPVAPLQGPIHLQARPNGAAFCTLRQRLVTDDGDPSSQVVTFETRVEGTADAAVLVQTVRGHQDTATSPATFGYQHRMTLAPTGLAVAAEARAIPGFPIDAAELRRSALDGEVDIRDAIFSGRTFTQDETLNRTPQATFRFLKPVIPRDLDLDAQVDRRDQSHVAGLVSSPDGRQSILFEIDAQMTTVRRAGATDTVFKGQLVVDRTTGLVAGEDWIARITKTSTDPFELITSVRCSVESEG